MRYPKSTMPHYYTPHPSIIWFAVLIAANTCISVLVTGCSNAKPRIQNQTPKATSALSVLVLEGHELHESLHSLKIGSIRDLPTGLVSPENPHLSNDDDFVLAVARGGSQGRLGRQGIRTALFARYSTGKNEVGFYGLETESETAAENRETALRDIWAHNASHGRSQVHRRGLVVLVVWHDDVSPECWRSVNQTVKTKLNSLSADD